MKRNVFIVHGHALADRDDLVRIIRSLRLSPVVLADAPRSGGTVIEEFERLAAECVFAFILLTPDDKQASDLLNDQRFRARQNVIFEMGWFFKALGRERTRLIYRGDVELPSDVTGVMYLEYKERVSEIRNEIRGSLVEGGLLTPN